MNKYILVLFCILYFLAGCDKKNNSNPNTNTHIHGYTKNINDTNIDGALVIISNKDNNWTAITDKNGYYNINFSRAFDNLLIKASIGQYYSKEKNITLSLGSTKNIDIKLDLDIDIPKDPGENGKITLEGIDRDDDGIRDDIQRYIVLNYKNKKNLQKALIQYVKTEQRSIIMSGDEDLAHKLAVKSMKNGNCIHSHYDDINIYFAVVDKIYSKIYNTKDRVIRRIQNDSLLGGHILGDGSTYRAGKKYPALETYCED